MHMPGMDGFERAEILTRDYPDSTLAMLTANVQSAIQERASKLKLHFVPKPISAAKISTLLKAATR